MFIEAFYNELTLDKQELFTAHLNECSRCAHEFAQMNSDLEAFNKPMRPELDWECFWYNTENQINKLPVKNNPILESIKRFSSAFKFQRRWVYQTVGVAAILIIGILIGRNFQRQDVFTENYSNETQISNRIANTALLERTASYLGRSKLVLLGLVNFDTNTDDPEAIDFARQKAISTELINEADVLKGQLTSPQQLVLYKLITELEVILLQIANLEDEYDLEAVELIQSSAEQKGILFKIRMEELLSGTNDNENLQINVNNTGSLI